MSLRKIAGKSYWVEMHGNGPAILLLHGLGGTSTVYQPQHALLSEHHTMVRVDLEGHGNSPLASTRLSIDQWADSIEAVLDDLSIPIAGTAAHSAGSLVALRLVQRNPQRFGSIALLGPVFGHSDSSRQALRARGVRARSEGLSAIADATVSTLSEQTRKTRPLAGALIRELVLRQNPTSYAAACDAVAETPIFSPSTFEEANLLLVTGDTDPVSPPAVSRDFAEGLPKARCELLAQCGHWPTIERPVEVASLLLSFFNSGAK